MRNGAWRQRYERNDGSGAGARAKDDSSRSKDPPMNHSFAGPANESKEAGAPAETMVSVEFHDIWLNFLVLSFVPLLSSLWAALLASVCFAQTQCACGLSDSLLNVR